MSRPVCPGSATQVYILVSGDEHVMRDMPKRFSSLCLNCFYFLFLLNTWKSFKERFLHQTAVWSREAAWLYVCKSPRFSTSPAWEKLNVKSAVPTFTLDSRATQSIPPICTATVLLVISPSRCHSARCFRSKNARWIRGSVKGLVEAPSFAKVLDGR